MVSADGSFFDPTSCQQGIFCIYLGVIFQFPKKFQKLKIRTMFYRYAHSLIYLLVYFPCPVTAIIVMRILIGICYMNL